MNSRPQFENMNDDATFYRFGVFYFNKKDSRFIVPKATKLGYTVNFAKPQAYLILAVIIIAFSIAVFLG